MKVLLFLICLTTHLTAGEKKLLILDEDLPDEKLSESFLIPADLVENIFKNKNDEDDFVIISASYMLGYICELCQLVTQNDVHNHKLRKDKFYQLGAEQCLANEGASSIQRVRNFGFVKCRLNVSILDGSVISFENIENEPFIYMSNKSKKSLKSTNKQDLIFVGWLSQPVSHFIPGGADERYNRIFVLESIAHK